MSIKFDISGDEQIIAYLDKVASTNNIQQALGKACALVERDAKIKAPKGNGDLRRSITSEVNGTEGKIFTPLYYAPYVEYGTGLFAENGGRSDVPWSYKDDSGNWWTTYGQHPKPYLRPAFDENKKQIVRILQEGLK